MRRWQTEATGSERAAASAAQDHDTDFRWNQLKMRPLFRASFIVLSKTKNVREVHFHPKHSLTALHKFHSNAYNTINCVYRHIQTYWDGETRSGG